MTVITEDEVLSSEHFEVGRGGQSIVYAVPGARISGLRFSLAYKRFRTPSPAAGGLRALVVKREVQPPHIRAVLDETTIWPLRIVEQEGLATGVLMRLIPSMFTHSVISPSGRQLPKRNREVQFLMVPDRRAAQLRIPIASLEERLAVCLEFSRAIALLHGIGVVVGDINARNALYTLRGTVKVLLIDCDGYRIVSTIAPRPQLESPDWDVPERGTLSLATDRYKLGLFVLRVLTPGERTSVSRDPELVHGVLGTRGIRLLRNALSTVSDARPPAEEWVEHLAALLQRVRVNHPTTGVGRWQ
jgi:DNA-binding helix-hairpin-helix protein with protein kinase domain